MLKRTPPSSLKPRALTGLQETKTDITAGPSGPLSILLPRFGKEHSGVRVLLWWRDSVLVQQAAHLRDHVHQPL